jgi:hypothetical protein
MSHEARAVIEEMLGLAIYHWRRGGGDRPGAARGSAGWRAVTWTWRWNSTVPAPRRRAMPTKSRLTQANYEAIRRHLFDRIHGTGEEIKNDFPNVLRWAIEHEAWKHFATFEGKPFANLVEWLHYSIPNGPMMGAGRHSINYEDALKLTEGASDVHRVLLENAPRDGKGRPSRKMSVDTHFPRGANKAKLTMTLSIRLVQEKPEFSDRYSRGEYRSITAAAMAAGLIRNDVNLRRAKSAFRKMTTEERAEFLKWLKEV